MSENTPPPDNYSRNALTPEERAVKVKELLAEVKSVEQLQRDLAAREAELAEARDALQFVERWANYHGVKPTCTAKAALSAIQHYPPIREITESYKDGKIPETRNPWEELSATTARAKKAEAERDEWRGAAYRVGELLGPIGPNGYYIYTAQQWADWATATINRSKAERDAAVKDAERIDWIERTLFDKQWNAVIDSGSRTYWRICGPYRHVTAKMVGGTFRAAIDAAKGER